MPYSAGVYPNAISLIDLILSNRLTKIIVLIINTKGGAMARTTSVTIGAQLDEFVNQLISSGRYGSTSEVVRSALRLLEVQEKQTAALKMLIDAGEQSGESSLTLQDIAKKVKNAHNV